MARPPTETRPTKTSTKDTAPPPSPRSFAGFSEVTSFLWSVADLLRGDYKQADYGKVILPLTVLRRLDCVFSNSFCGAHGKSAIKVVENEHKKQGFAGCFGPTRPRINDGSFLFNTID